MLVKELILELQKYPEDLLAEVEDEFGAIGINSVVLIEDDKEKVVTILTL